MLPPILVLTTNTAKHKTRNLLVKLQAVIYHALPREDVRGYVSQTVLRMVHLKGLERPRVPGQTEGPELV